jgi:hypothetical protein
MLPESCFGIDIVDGRWLVVVQRRNGKNLLYRRFENTVDGFTSLLKSIQDRAANPKVCIKSAGRTALTLALRIGSIPQIEVILLSYNGLQQAESRLQHTKANTSESGYRVAAETLARCAERMI